MALKLLVLRAALKNVRKIFDLMHDTKQTAIGSKDRRIFDAPESCIVTVLLVR